MSNSIGKILIAFGVILFYISCKDDHKKNQRKKIGDLYVEAMFKNDSVIDGIAKFFKNDSNIISIVNYVNGKKNGSALNYFENGKRKDSMYFTNDVKNGFEYAYDTLGQLYSIDYQYYGLRMGPQLFLSKGITKEYYYTDFNKEDLIVCKYDSVGNFNDLVSFSTKPRISKVIIDNNKMLDFFVYLPNPPAVNVEYMVGLTNNKRQDKNLFIINNDRVFFDTLLSYPEKGWHYFISTHLQSTNGTLNKIFIEEIQHDE